MRAWRHAPTYDARRGSVVTWLLSITRNLAIDRLRVEQARPVDELDRLVSQPRLGGAATRREAVTGDEMRRVRAALEGLPGRAAPGRRCWPRSGGEPPRRSASWRRSRSARRRPASAPPSSTCATPSSRTGPAVSDPFDPRDPSTGHLDDDMAVELALGLATGRERAGSLAHLAECSGCRGRVDGLRETGDGLLLLAPPAEPPAGFEQAVLASLRAARPSAAPAWLPSGAASGRGRRRWSSAAPSASASLLGRTAGGAVARPTGLARRRCAPRPGSTWAPSGATRATRRGCSCRCRAGGTGRPDGDAAREYRLQLTLSRRSQGRRSTTPSCGPTTAPGRRPSPPTPTTWSSVSVVDESGQVWCTGRFITSA